MLVVFSAMVVGQDGQVLGGSLQDLQGLLVVDPRNGGQGGPGGVGGL